MALRRRPPKQELGYALIPFLVLGCNASPGSVGSSFGTNDTEGDASEASGSTGATAETSSASESTSESNTGTDTADPFVLDVGSSDEEGDPCSAIELGASYIGCEYYAVTMLQYMWGDWPNITDFAVSIANASEEPAEVTISRGETELESFTVDAGSIEVVKLPWVFELTGQGHAPPTSVVPDGSYRVQSTRPVTVHQYSPLETTGGSSTGSNDASLLLPTNTWRDEYVVVGWPAQEDQSAQDHSHGAYVVIAREDATVVTVSGSATTMTQPGAGIDDQGDGIVMLDAGDVLQVVTWEQGSAADGDLTGSRIVADKPVSVISGHQATRVPDEYQGWDHLEDAMLPVESAGKKYVLKPPSQYPDTDLDKATVVRIVATEDDTELTFDPPQDGVPTTIPAAGDFIEIPMSTARYVVESNERILVAQFMVGEEAGYGTSDPSMLLAVPLEQWRHDYLFFAPTSWANNFVDVVTTEAATVSLDGEEITDWTPVGTTGYKHARVLLSNEGNGTHTLTAFPHTAGIDVYGVQVQGSYWYPGGLDLQIVPAG